MKTLKQCSIIVGIAFLFAFLYGLHVAFRVVLEPPSSWAIAFAVTAYYTFVFSIIGFVGYGFYRLYLYSKPYLRPFVAAFALAWGFATAFIGMLVMTRGLLHEEEYQPEYVLMLIASWAIPACLIFGLMAAPFAAGIYMEQRKKTAEFD